MAWSAKLQSGTGGVSGYNEWETVFNASTQTAYKLHYGLSLGSQAPDVLYHTPDNGSPMPIRANGNNRLIFLTVDIPTQATWNDVLNKAAVFARLVDGPDSQAIRAQMDGSADKVRVAIEPDGATYTTYFDVISGFIDTSTAFTEPVAVINTMARSIIIALTCAPYGYGDTFTLRNDLASSPHMIEDTNADGLADGLSLLSTPTATIGTTHYLISGKAQKAVTTDVNQGFIATYSASGSIGDTCAVKGYVQIQTAAKTVICQIRNGGATVISTVTLPAGATQTITGPSGVSWYEFNLSATATTTNGWQIYTYAPETATTFFIDGLYLQTGTLTVPPSWASSSSLKNRYDPASTSAATRQQINYLDVWGVLGDAPAFVKYTITLPSISRNRIVASRHTSGIYNAANVRTWIESDEFSTSVLGVTGTWSDAADANRTDGHYKRYTETAAAGPYNAGSASVLLTGSTARAFAKTPRRVYGILRSSSTSVKFLLSASIAGVSACVPIAPTGTSVSATNTWEFVDLGMVNAQGLLPDTVPDDTGQSILIGIDIDNTAASTTSDIDALMIFVAKDDFIIWAGAEDTKSSGGDIIFDGKEKAIISEGSAIYESGLGGLWYVIPRVGNRIIFAIASADDAHVITDAYPVSLEITPRTSHLLGTL